MNSVVGVVIALVVLSLIFLLMGNRFCRLFHREEKIEFQWLLGFALFLAVFAVVDLPIELLQKPFHTLVYAEVLVVLGVTAVCAVWYLREKKGSSLFVMQRPDKLTIIFLLMIALQIIYGMNNRVYASYYDTCYYNGHAINAIYTDTLYQYDAYTGWYVGEATAWNDSYPMLIAVLAKVFGMHPLVAINRIIAILEIVAVNGIVYEIAYRLSGAKKETAVWTVGIHAVLSLFCWNSVDSTQYYLWVRMAESKSMLANVYLPLVLLGLIMLAKEIDNKYNWFVLAVIAFAGVSMSLSGIFITTVMMGVGLLSILLYHRKVRYFLYAVLCIAPSLIMGAIRMLG